MSQITLRYSVEAKDIMDVRRLVESTGFFNAEEIMIAGELVEEKLTKESSSYHFLFAEQDKKIIGYTCFGLIPFTDGRFDLYWIAVSPLFQKQGLGKLLLNETEKLVLHQQGVKLYTETSGREDYLPPRNFYLRNKYQQVAELPDFYRTGDSKVLYCKDLQGLH